MVPKGYVGARRAVIDSDVLIQIKVVDGYRVQLLLTGSPKLQSGESEATVQAQEQNISVLLTNDRDAIKVARRHGLLTVTFQELEQRLQELEF